jgi:uncharacterized protein DUF4386
MSTAVMTQRPAETSPRLKARIAGTFYLLTFVTGSLALLPGSGRVAADLAATACYVAVILLFHQLFKPVDRNLSLLAVCFGLAGCAFGALSLFRTAPFPINSLVFFGFYCLLIGTLIFKSTFLPRILGAGMALAGLGWLTFASAGLAHSLAPYNMIPGVVGEGALTLWLLVMGVNAARWNERAGLLGKRV